MKGLQLVSGGLCTSYDNIKFCRHDIIANATTIDQNVKNLLEFEPSFNQCRILLQKHRISDEDI